MITQLGRKFLRKFPLTGALRNAPRFTRYEAVYLGKPLYERVVTAADSLENPANLWRGSGRLSGFDRDGC